MIMINKFGALCISLNGSLANLDGCCCYELSPWQVLVNSTCKLPTCLMVSSWYSRSSILGTI